MGIKIVTTPHKTCETPIKPLALVTQNTLGLTIVYCYLLIFTLNINYLSYCLNNLSNMSSFLSVGYQWTFIYLALFTTKTITALGVLSQGTFLTTLCSFKDTFLGNINIWKKWKWCYFPESIRLFSKINVQPHNYHLCSRNLMKFLGPQHLLCMVQCGSRITLNNLKKSSKQKDLLLGSHSHTPRQFQWSHCHTQEDQEAVEWKTGRALKCRKISTKYNMRDHKCHNYTSGLSVISKYIFIFLSYKVWL